MLIKLPRKSKASRRPSLRSTASFRGAWVDWRANREVVFESLLEHDLGVLLATDRNVVSVQEQPKAVSFHDADGVPRQHVFDFLAVLRDGSRLAIDVKPSSRIDRSRIREVVDLIATQVGERFADRYAVRTENDAPRAAVLNAKLQLRSRRLRRPENVQKLVDAVGTVRGSLAVKTLLKVAGLPADAFMDVVALVDDGILALSHAARLDLNAMVEPCRGDAR